MPKPPFCEIISELKRLAESATDFSSLQKFAVDVIAQNLPYYDWVGFYMLDPDDSSVLVLGPYHGAPTDHLRIPVTKGICGAAVATGETVVIDDVTTDPRYLACSLETRSEIVVPIRVNQKIAGEIDIDSHTVSAFGPDDRRFLEECATLFGRFIQETRDKLSPQADDNGLTI